MVGVDLKNSSTSHELQAWCVTKGLCLHEPIRIYRTHVRKIKALRQRSGCMGPRTWNHLSMLADQPNLPETRTHGEELSRFEIWTLATLSPSCCFIQSHRRVYSCLLSFSLSSSSSPVPAIMYKHVAWALPNPKSFILNHITTKIFAYPIPNPLC